MPETEVTVSTMFGYVTNDVNIHLHNNMVTEIEEGPGYLTFRLPGLNITFHRDDPILFAGNLCDQLDEFVALHKATTPKPERRQKS